MYRYKKTNVKSQSLGIVAAMVLVALSPLGPYAPSFVVQYQPQQQSATITIASINGNMTNTSPSANATTTVANATTTNESNAT